MGQITEKLCSDLSQYGQRNGIMHHYHCQALANRLARLDPATGGHIGLVHNWGNPESRAALASANAKRAKYLAYRDTVYSQILERARHV